MQKRWIAALLVAFILLGTFAACKKNESQSAATTSATAAQGSSENSDQSDSKSKTSKQNKDSDKSAVSSATSEGTGANSSNSSESSDSEQSGTEKTGGWKKQSDGSFTKGEAKLNVARYGSATVDEGEELIKQLIKNGMRESKVLSSEKSETGVITTVSGKRIGNGEKEFVKFQFVKEGGKAYLVTLIAENEADLTTDISYVLSNLAALAK